MGLGCLLGAYGGGRRSLDAVVVSLVLGGAGWWVCASNAVLFGGRVAGIVVWWRGGDCVFFMAIEREAW